MTTIQEEFEQQKETLHKINDIPMEHKIRAIFDNIMNELEPGVEKSNILTRQIHFWLIYFYL